MTPFEMLVPPLVLLGYLGVMELARTLVARAGKVRIERYWVRMMRLPVDNGPRWARVGTIVVGPVALWISITLLAFALFCCHGSRGAIVVVDRVMPEYAAAGTLEPGDRIVSVDGTPFAGGGNLLSALVNDKAGAPLTLAIDRAGNRREVTIQPTQSDDERWRLGVALVPELDRDVGAAAVRALRYPAVQFRGIARGFADIFAGAEQPEPGGPVRIVNELSPPRPAASAASVTGLAMLLGVYLLFPILLLDLVRLVLLARRKRG